MVGMPRASAAPLRLVTPRDLDVLAALDYAPLTAAQLLKISRTFLHPFSSERRVRKRLRVLCFTKRVQSFPYATAGSGAPNYYTLTRLGYRLLHGDTADPPVKRAFGPIGLARQHHTHSLAEFIVHTIVAAHEAGLDFTNFTRENTLRIAVGEQCLYPDCGFDLMDPTGEQFSFLVEIDAGSERIRSPKEVESWERKIRLYDQYQDALGRRFRVLIVATHGPDRADRLLQMAAKLVKNPHRSLFYGISLSAYLACPDPLRAPCFRDHQGRSVSLVPARLSSLPASSPQPVRGPPPRDLPSLST